MKLIDNVNTRLGDDLKETIRKGSKLSIAASTFSIYAFEALKKELGKVDELRFIFSSPPQVKLLVSSGSSIIIPGSLS